MLALFIEESRKDLAALTAALDRQDKEAAASILHKNLPLWETVRLDFPLSHLRELVTEPATEWTNRQSMEMRDIIRAVEKLIVYAENTGGKPMKTILIIEDDIVFSRSISNWLVKKGMKTECVATLANARKAIGQKEFDLILADLRLPDGNSTSLLKWMNEKYYSIPFLIMTNYGQVENAVTTMQLGAINYLCKPVQPDNLLALITEILDKNDNEQEFYRGESPKAHEMYRLIEMIACADISVLLRGASGTGKEHIAAEIHARSHRKNKPYLAIDCGAISDELAASEFFGHQKGAFTGAESDKVGLFRAVNGGTLFLDEIGNLSYKTQMLLLRALQEKRCKPVGSTKEYSFDIRLVAATNENLEKPSEKDASGKTCSTGSMSSLCGFLHWQNAGKTSFLWLIFS